MAKYAAFGTLLKRGDGGGPEVFATIGGVRDITGPGLSTETIDVTSHDSANATREFVASLKDGGEVTFDVVFDPDNTTHQNLRTDWQNRTVRNFQMVLPDAAPATTWSFSGIVTSYSQNAPVAGELSISVTIKVSGQPSLA